MYNIWTNKRKKKIIIFFFRPFVRPKWIFHCNSGARENFTSNTFRHFNVCHELYQTIFFSCVYFYWIGCVLFLTNLFAFFFGFLSFCEFFWLFSLPFFCLISFVFLFFFALTGLVTHLVVMCRKKGKIFLARTTHLFTGVLLFCSYTTVVLQSFRVDFSFTAWYFVVFQHRTSNPNRNSFCPCYLYVCSCLSSGLCLSESNVECYMWNIASESRRKKLTKKILFGFIFLDTHHTHTHTHRQSSSHMCWHSFSI